MSERPARFDGIPIKVWHRVLARDVIVYLSPDAVDSESEIAELIWQSLPLIARVKKLGEVTGMRSPFCVAGVKVCHLLFSRPFPPQLFILSAFV